MISGLDSSSFLRNLDTKSMALTFRGDAYQLQRITLALEQVYAQAAQQRYAR